MRTIGLFRVSTIRQENEGASLDAQQRSYRELVASRGWTSVAEFRGCESATQAGSERKVLQQVLECIRETLPDACCVHEQSRLTRGDELEVALLLRELRERQMKIVVGGVIRDLASIDERFMVGIQSLVDRAESERIKERMQRGKRERARQGKKSSGPTPFGYMNPAKVSGRHGTLEIVPEQAVVVRRIFELCRSGMGSARIANTLNAEGIQSPTGGRFGKTTVNRILMNPAYIGHHVSNAWVAPKGSRTFRFEPRNPKAIIVEAAHEAIIPRELWDVVRGRAPLPRTERPRMLTGLLHLNGRRATGNADKHKAFYCWRRGESGGPWLPARDTDEAVWRGFVSLACDPRVVASMIAQSHNRERLRELDEEVVTLETQVGKFDRKLDGLVEMRAGGEITKELFASKVAQLRQVREHAAKRLDAARIERASCDVTQADRVVATIRTLLAGHSDLSTAQKRTMLRSIVRRVDVSARATVRVQSRDILGRVQPLKGSKWQVGDVRLTLAIPPHGGGSATNGRGCAVHSEAPMPGTPDVVGMGQVL